MTQLLLTLLMKFAHLTKIKEVMLWMHIHLCTLTPPWQASFARLLVNMHSFVQLELIVNELCLSWRSIKLPCLNRRLNRYRYIVLYDRNVKFTVLSTCL